MSGYLPPGLSTMSSPSSYAFISLAQGNTSVNMVFREFFHFPLSLEGRGQGEGENSGVPPHLNPLPRGERRLI
jgi:hypothetical protein